MLEEYFNMPIMYSLIIIVGLLGTLSVLLSLIGTLFYYVLSQDKLPSIDKLFNKHTLLNKLTFNFWSKDDDLPDILLISAFSILAAFFIGFILDIIFKFCLLFPLAALTLLATGVILLTLRFISGKLWVNVSKTKSNTKRIKKLEK